jgi:hypothetical protein
MGRRVEERFFRTKVANGFGHSSPHSEGGWKWSERCLRSLPTKAGVPKRRFDRSLTTL